MSAAMTMKLVSYLSFSAVVLLAACAWAQDAPPDTSAAHALDTIRPAPVTGLSARDYVDNSDAGDKIELTWVLSPDDGGGAEDVVSYQLWRSGGAEAEWDSLGTAAAGEWDEISIIDDCEDSNISINSSRKADLIADTSLIFLRRALSLNPSTTLLEV